MSQSWGCFCIGQDATGSEHVEMAVAPLAEANFGDAEPIARPVESNRQGATQTSRYSMLLLQDLINKSSEEQGPKSAESRVSFFSPQIAKQTTEGERETTEGFYSESEQPPPTSPALSAPAADAAPPAAEVKQDLAAEEPPPAAQVQALQDIGRTLEACRLLDVLSNDAEVPSAQRIREISSTATGKIGAVRRAILEAAAPGSAWSQRSEPGVNVYVQYDKWTGAAEVVGQLEFDIPALQLWAVFREFDLAPLWLPNCVASKLVHSFDKESELTWTSSVPVVSMLSKTDAFQHRNYLDCLDEHKCLIVLGISPPVDTTEYWDIALAPPPSGLKRVSAGVFNMITPVSKTRSQMTIQIELASPFLFLPAWIVTKIASIILGKFLTSIREVYADWKAREWAGRMAGSRADYYAAKQSRIDKVLQ